MVFRFSGFRVSDLFPELSGFLVFRLSVSFSEFSGFQIFGSLGFLREFSRVLIFEFLVLITECSGLLISGCFIYCVRFWVFENLSRRLVLAGFQFSGVQVFGFVSRIVRQVS